jgi:NAD(P)-dependent dehydrogenase (short-subunit alcohol dehydrogenase family)
LPAEEFLECGLTEAAALDLAKYDIRVNSVHRRFVRIQAVAATQLLTSHGAMDWAADDMRCRKRVSEERSNGSRCWKNSAPQKY